MSLWSVKQVRIQGSRDQKQQNMVLQRKRENLVVLKKKGDVEEEDDGKQENVQGHVKGEISIDYFDKDGNNEQEQNQAPFAYVVKGLKHVL